jgi:hypothetical protein
MVAIKGVSRGIIPTIFLKTGSINSVQKIVILDNATRY